MFYIFDFVRGLSSELRHASNITSVTRINLTQVANLNIYDGNDLVQVWKYGSKVLNFT